MWRRLQTVVQRMLVIGITVTLVTVTEWSNAIPGAACMWVAHAVTAAAIREPISVVLPDNSTQPAAAGEALVLSNGPGGRC